MSNTTTTCPTCKKEFINLLEHQTKSHSSFTITLKLNEDKLIDTMYCSFKQDGQESSEGEATLDCEVCSSVTHKSYWLFGIKGEKVVSIGMNDDTHEVISVMNTTRRKNGEYISTKKVFFDKKRVKVCIV